VLHDSWGETAWLQSLGFYSLECWVANRVELLLWRGWHEARACTKSTPAPSLPPPPPSSSSSLRGLVCKSLSAALCEHRAAAAAAAPGERGRYHHCVVIRCAACHLRTASAAIPYRAVDDIRALISVINASPVCGLGFAGLS
jgi:hypothetical protein